MARTAVLCIVLHDAFDVEGHVAKSPLQTVKLIVILMIFHYNEMDSEYDFR